MAESVGIRALQQHASKVVARVAAGEELEITDRGRAVARLVPLHRDPLDELVASGRLRQRRCQPGLRRLIRLPAGTPTAAEVLAEMRRHER
ncbi:MAG: type II toxin-antitoxin system prevent-host-death family antitoxin [Actinobacteria bacterium]|nr:type II toxin-antitoxin system prevent-host-death family antitoxin [Actinomycetota bacterium]